MLDRMFETLHFAFRQRTAFNDAVALLKQLFTFKVPFKKVFASFLAVAEMFSASFWDTPRTPRGPELDLSGYELVFEDEFNSDAVNTDIWTIADSGRYSADQVRLEDGNLIIRGEYRDGVAGETWYAGEILLKEYYCKGYYEIRCKVFPCTSRKDLWSAFWLMVDGAYDANVSQGGVGGCEIDIYESFADVAEKKDYPVGITPAIWCNGIDDRDDHLDGVNLGQWRSNDPINEYNTYGVLWTDEYYIWYINGVEAFRVNYGSGPSQVPEQLRVSLCLPSVSAEKMTRAKDDPADYAVDYVRIWQPAD